MHLFVRSLRALSADVDGSYHHLLLASACEPITVVAPSEALTAIALSNTEVLSLKPTRGNDVCARLFHVCVVQCVGNGLMTG
jgi:hypothetical protein